MVEQPEKGGVLPLDLTQEAYAQLLELARQVSDKTVERLQHLHDRFPADVPQPVPDQEPEVWEYLDRDY